VPPIGAWVRVSQQRLLAAPNVHARIDVPYDEPFRTAEVVSIEGEFVKLRTIAAKREDLCGTLRGADPSFEIHFFTEVDALQPVLREPKLVELDDGTKLAFAAGVPVDLSGSEPSLQLGGASFFVPLAKHEIGWWFPAVPTQPPAASTSSWRGSKPLHYGERSIEADGPPFVDVRDQRRLDDGNTLLTFADACGQFTLRVEGEMPIGSGGRGLYQMKGPKNANLHGRNVDADMAARNAGILAIMAEQNGGWAERDCSPIHEAPAGVAVTWRDSGNIAGVTRASVELPNDAQELDGKLCFTTDDLAVCISSDLLTRKDEPDCVPVSNGFMPLDGAGAGNPGVVGRQGSRVEMSTPQVTPGLDPEIVRRIVRAHINELRSCYNQGQVKQPQLAGSITIAFEIGATGKVTIASVQEATLEPADDGVTRCFAKAVKRWQFPKPSGASSVSVSFPFELLSL
jgi:hypothetical protein